MLKLFYTSILSLFLSSCSTVELTKEGQLVEVKKSDPPENCKEIDVVNSLAGSLSGGPKTARILLRNKAAKMGGNYIRLDSSSKEDGAYEATGTVFLCPPK